MSHTPNTQRPSGAAPAPKNPGWKSLRRWGVAGFFAAHLPLGLLVYNSPSVAKLHAFGALAVGLLLAVSGRRLERVAYAAAYIIGAEVLWRMAGADIFWEFGKYAVVAVFTLAMVRGGGSKGSALPVTYFALLIPSALLITIDSDLSDARREISFNLSGPLALMISARFFSTRKLSAEQLRNLFLSAIGPLIGVAFVTLFATISTPDIDFGSESNVATSGGFGPNQVSGALGLGVLLALFCVLDDNAKRSFRILLFGVMAFLAAQSALTFSRGGLYNTAGAALLASFYLLREARSRVTLIAMAGALFIAANFIILPSLDSFTGGALSARFQDTGLTNRDEIVWQDLQIWEENPVFGVGPGESHQHRKRMFPELALPAHTEFSRLVAEHGLFGLAAILTLLAAGVQNIKRARDARGKAVVTAVMVWSCLFMLNAAMRLAAPSLMFGLAFASLLPNNNALANPVRKRGAKPEGSTVSSYLDKKRLPRPQRKVA